MSVDGIVLDCGSLLCKAGFAGDDAPCAVFPTVVGRPLHPGAAGLKDVYVGHDALSNRALVSMQKPISRGTPVDWDAVEVVWRHAFDQLGVLQFPDLPRALLCETPLARLEDRERSAEIMFEALGVPALCIKNQAELAVFATGQKTGLALDVGDGATHAVAVHDGRALPGAQRVEFGGRDLTEHLSALLEASGYSFAGAPAHEILRDIKARVGYVACDYAAEVAACAANPALYARPYEWPGATNPVHYDAERFRLAEPLFSDGSALPGLTPATADIPGALSRAISACDADVRPALFSNIVLSGGSTLFPGFVERLTREAAHFSPAGTALTFYGDAAGPQHRVWQAGSMVASLTASAYSGWWMTRAEYDECGPVGIHEKCAWTPPW